MVAAAPPLPIDVHLRTRSADAPFPLDEPGCRLFARARHGIWHSVRHLGLEAGDEILVPAYHHGSEVEALTRAGLVCRFYGRAPGLEPDEGELTGLRSPRVRALYLIHYLGFPQDVERWRRWCDDNDLILMEDVAQSWLATAAGRPLGSFGDAAYFCLYKTCGVPDGAAVLLSGSVGEGWKGATEGRKRSGIGGAARRHAGWVVSRSSLLSRLESARRGNAAYEPALDFALGDVDLPPSRTVSYLLRRLADGQRVVARRRANYRHMLERLGGCVPRPFDRLPETAVPYVFPIETDEKERLVRRLEASGVRAFNLWSVPHPSLPRDAFPDAAGRRERIVGLPVHQELTISDLDRITAAFTRAAGKGAGTLTTCPPGNVVSPEADARASADSAPPPEALKRPNPDARPSSSGRPLHREAVDSVAALEVEWDELARRSRNIFATREWNRAWWRHYGRGDLRISGWRDDEGRLVAILPLYATRRGPLRILRFVGHGAANELGPICRPQDRHAAALALRRELDESRDEWNLFLGSLLPGEEPWSHLVGGHVLRRHPNPQIRIEGRSWDDYLQSLSSKFRKEIRYSESRLRRRYDVCYRTSKSPGELERDMSIFLGLHAARWEDESSILPRSAFYREVAAAFLERGWLQLSILELDSAPVAARFDFRFAGVLSAYNAGRDPAWQRESLGLVLRVMTMRQAFAEGAEEYRFLLGGEQYKYRFAPEDPGLETIARSSGAIGTSTLTTVRALVRTPRGRALLRSVVAR